MIFTERRGNINYETNGAWKMIINEQLISYVLFRVNNELI